MIKDNIPNLFAVLLLVPSMLRTVPSSTVIVRTDEPAGWICNKETINNKLDRFKANFIRLRPEPNFTFFCSQNKHNTE